MFNTRGPFPERLPGFTFPLEQFWGRAARASWVRKNPDARLICLCSADTLVRGLWFFLVLLLLSRQDPDAPRPQGLYSLPTSRGQDCPRRTSKLNLWKW